jgi:FAD synthetase
MVNRSQVRRKPVIVLAAGVFDVLHLGHVRFLEEAKRAGGKDAELIVIVARDKTVEKRKGEKPVIPENQRRALVESLKIVDEAILGYEEFDMGKVIQKVRPNVIAVGHDQANIGENVRRAIAKRGLRTRVVKIGKFGEDELNSSSEIKRKIIELYRRRS